MRFVVAGLVVVLVVFGVWRQSWRDNVRKSVQREVRLNLRGAFFAQTEFFKERGRYGDFSETGFIPERGNRAVYVLGGGPIQRRTERTSPTGAWGVIGAEEFHREGNTDALLAMLPSTVSPGISDAGVTVVAIADADQDGHALIMSVATFDRPQAKTGVPFVEQQD